MKSLSIVKCKNSNKSGYLEMLEQHQDISGKRYPAGTLYKPIRNGFDHLKGYYYHEAEIRGKKVVFPDRSKIRNNVKGVLYERKSKKKIGDT